MESRFGAAGYGDGASESGEPEPEGARLLGREAIVVAREIAIDSIRQRTRELAAELWPWLHLPSVADFLNEADGWLATERGGCAAE